MKRDWKDEELAAIKLSECPSCGSHNVSVRRVRQDEYYIGCMDCENKRLSDGVMLLEVIDAWERYAENVRRNKRLTRGEERYGFE